MLLALALISVLGDGQRRVLLSVPALMQRWGLSRTTIQRYVRKGRLHPVYHGVRKRVFRFKRNAQIEKHGFPK
jgi:predicted site-specific integrase-resolvase